MEIIDRIKELVKPYLDENGIELVDIIYRREQVGMVLRLLVDTKAGIKMHECEALNRFVGDMLDAENVIDEHYTIEVSSPGLDRPITTDKDFERSLDKELDVTTYEMVDSRKTHEGRLIGISKDEIVLERGGISTVIPRKLIARSRLKLEF